MCRPTISASSYDNTNDRVTDCHANRASYHQWLPADFVDNCNGWNSSKEVDHANDAGSEKRGSAASKAKRLEDVWCVIGN